MNKVILKGRLTNDPDLRTTPNGNIVAKFTVAVNRRFDRERTDFINCEAWKNTAEFIGKFFKKGKEISLIGELHIDKSEKDGKTVYYTSVVAEEVEFCGNKGDNQETKEPEHQPPENALNFETLDDGEELPF
jgi:single-strand DNA-binding protein